MEVALVLRDYPILAVSENPAIAFDDFVKGQFGKVEQQWKEVVSECAVIRPEWVASVTEVCNFPEADFWGVSQKVTCPISALTRS